MVLGGQPRRWWRALQHQRLLLVGTPSILLHGLGIPFTGLAPAQSGQGRAPTCPRRPGLGPGGRAGAGLDRLAIVEYLAERHPGLSPANPVARLARCCCAEMHGGFQALRSELSMDVAARRPQRQRRAADIARLGSRAGARRVAASGGPFLFGAFGADAYFAPVAFRYRAWSRAQVVRALLAHPSVRAWAEAGAREPVLPDHKYRRDVPGQSAPDPARRPGRPPAPRGASLHPHVRPRRRRRLRPAPPPAGYRWLVLGTCSVGCSTPSTRSTRSPRSEELGMARRLGLLDTSYNVAALLTLIAGGVLIDPPTSAILFAAVGAVGTLLIAVLPALFPAAPWAVVSVLLGIGLEETFSSWPRPRWWAAGSRGRRSPSRWRCSLWWRTAVACSPTRSGPLQAALRQLAPPLLLAAALGGAWLAFAVVYAAARRRGGARRRRPRCSRTWCASTSATGGWWGSAWLLPSIFPFPHLRQPLLHRRPRRDPEQAPSESCRCSR